MFGDDFSKWDLIGSWRLVTFYARTWDGTRTVYPLGQDATGFLIYGADGYMSTQIMRAARPAYEANGPIEDSDCGSAFAASGYLAYSGRYWVDGNSVVGHEIEVSLFPNWLGTTVSRNAVLKGQQLELTTIEPVLFGDEQLTGVLVWERTGM
ncbi:lipocalin-like domain-containing protein [Saccharopolyspora sp. K220]|uniref:lipocalin-like domain-containing protein n=1 Tax=Saccharopolyspora soli TaxID=2926618 RepID=UPI001F575DBA|nr:lipocalin-like domain-containing protein [Saccharopolyspora soli]MCI2417453.1 lipocalin-like domain-containing protein [Saccharopolyspora soli]